MRRSAIEGLVSPELDFALFCRRVANRGHEGVADAAGMESALLHREYRERSGRSIRPGSRRFTYCEDLRRLAGMLIGNYPTGIDQTYFLAVAPIFIDLLIHRRWRIGDLNELFSWTNIEAHLQEAGKTDTLLASVLLARDAGRRAGSAVMESWRARHGPMEKQGYQASAVMHLSIRSNSRRARDLFALAERYPFALRADRDSPSGISLAILRMTDSIDQEMNIAAEEAALASLRGSLRVTGYVTSYES